MYRNQDGDNGRPSVQAVPEAQPIDQTELTGLHQAEAEAAATPLPGAAPSPVRAQRTSRRKVILVALVLAAVGTGGWFGYHYLTVGRFLVTTDDAYVQAYNTTLAAKVAGYVASVPVTTIPTYTAAM